MIKNYFYFMVGCLCLVFAVTHTWNGLETTLPMLNNAEINGGIKTTFTYIWHIIGVENLVFGIALLIMAFQKEMEKVKFTAQIIIAILIVRWIVIISFSLFNNENSVIDVLTDTIAIFIVLILLYLGTRGRNKVKVE